MFRFHFGLPLVTSNENKNKIKLFSFGIARESPKCTLNISPPFTYTPGYTLSRQTKSSILNRN